MFGTEYDPPAKRVRRTLNDNADEKWQWDEHTGAKHAVLVRYVKAWMPILGRAAKRAGFPARLALIDGFAGRGKYMGDEPGSPLLLYDVASQVLQAGVADQVELFLVEGDNDNCRDLKEHVAALTNVDGLLVRGPECCPFAKAAQGVILKHLRPAPRPSFWFIDPFGFSGVPLSLIRQILSFRFSEVFITFMVRDLNRFLTDAQHRSAVSEILGLDGQQFDEAIQKVCTSSNRALALRDLYESRLLQDGGAKYVWPFRVATRGAGDTVYYLIHASTAPKALREMKKATYAVGGWQYAFLGRDDFSARAQIEIPEFRPGNKEPLKELLMTTFAGSELAYERLLDEAVPDRQFFWWVDKHFHDALGELIAEKRIRKTPVSTKSERGVSGDDLLRFPPTQPAV